MSDYEEDWSEVINENTRLREALAKIAAIPNQDWGGDWEEIEEARAIANSALTNQ